MVLSTDDKLLPLAFSADSPWLISKRESKVHLWDLDFDRLIQQAAARPDES